MLKRSFLSLIAAGALLTAFGSSPVLAADDTKKNSEVVLAFLDGVFNKHKVKESFDKYVGPTYTQHQPKVADGIEAGIKGLTWLTTEKHPNMRIEVKRSAAQGDLVWVHLRQIHDEEDAKSGRGQAVAEIFRLANGRIVEHWDVVEEIPETSANTNTMF